MHPHRRLKPLEGYSQTLPYKFAHTAMEIHERGHSPPEFYPWQERIREEPSLVRATQHTKLANAMTGGSFGDWIVRAKHWLQGTLDPQSNSVNGGSDQDDSDNIIERAFHTLSGGSVASKTVAFCTTQSLRAYGQEKVVKVSVVRIPQVGMLLKVVHLINNKIWGGANGELPFDDIFKLYIKIALANGIELILEKAPKVRIFNARKKFDGRPHSELSVPLASKNATLQLMLHNTMDLVGLNNYTSYDPFNHNNQAFINAFLTANAKAGLISYSPKLKAFVTESVSSIAAQHSKKIRDFDAYALKRATSKKKLKGGSISENVLAEAGAENENLQLGMAVDPSTDEPEPEAQAEEEQDPDEQDPVTEPLDEAEDGATDAANEEEGDSQPEESKTPQSLAENVHFEGVRDDAGEQPSKDTEEPIPVHLNDFYPLTGLMSGTSQDRLNAVDSFTPNTVDFLKKSIAHVTSTPGLEKEHPLVTTDHLNYFTESPDFETAQNRLKILQSETGQGLLNDLAVSGDSSQVIPSWINTNIMQPLYEDSLKPMAESTMGSGGSFSINSTLRHLQGGGLSEVFSTPDVSGGSIFDSIGSVLGSIFG